jgi:nicotinamidase-related amidase
MRNDATLLAPDDCFMLVVDVQQSMLALCKHADRTFKHCMALIEMATILDLPIIFSEHNADKLGGVIPNLLEKVSDAPVLNKLAFSCFQDAQLRETMDALGRKTLILIGLETHVCIFQTGADALQRGYGVHVAMDAVCSRSTLNWEVGLRRLERAGAVVSSTEMVIFELLNRAGTPEFRRALPLIKTL